MQAKKVLINAGSTRAAYKSNTHNQNAIARRGHWRMDSPLYQARKAVVQGDYPCAEDIYQQALQFNETSMSNLDIILRYAWCAEQNKHINIALAAYEKVIDIYRKTGEFEAAEELHRAKQYLRDDKPRPKNIATPGFGIGTFDDALIDILTPYARNICLQSNQQLCKVEDDVQNLYLLLEGRLDIHPHKHQQQANPGEQTLCLKNAYFFTRQRSPYTVYTATPCKLLRIPLEHLQQKGTHLQTLRGMDIKFIQGHQWLEPILAKAPLFSSIRFIQD